VVAVRRRLRHQVAVAVLSGESLNDRRI
jgi:hypothetical protein